MDKTEREAALEEAARFVEYLGDQLAEEEASAKMAKGIRDLKTMAKSGIRYLKKQDPMKFRS